jgi:uncharacterized phage protein (TIGR02218 family)
MRKIPPLLLADLKVDATSLAFLWLIEMANGKVIRGTEHDQDITIPTDANSGESPGEFDSPSKFEGTYYAVANVTAGDIASTTDLSVDNLEVTGALASPNYIDSPLKYTVLDVSVDEIESGLLDQAPVTIIICNWMAPSHGYFVVKSGFLGAITRNSDGKYTTEVRGLTQPLAQNIIRTYTASCNVVRFGDARCKFNFAPYVITGTVAADTSGSRYQFTVDLEQGSPRSGFPYVNGTLTFTSGANEGYFREVKIDPNANDGVIEFWDPFPEDVNPGDAFTLSPGCNRLLSTCQIYGNVINFRGFGVGIPGVDSLTAGPTTTTELGS